MNKNLFFAMALAGLFYAGHASASLNAPQDTVKTYMLNEVVISSTKETNALKQLPASVSIINPQMIRENRIEALSDLASLAPNLYIPNYGAKLTSAIYIRGIGARSSGQSVGVYVDNAALPDKSMFNSELFDVMQMEVHRGPQGTLYGRNAMGGIINVYTLSPLDFQGGKASLSAATFGDVKAKASYYLMLGRNIGLSVAGYYHRNDGFFKNVHTGKMADAEESFGGRLKLAWQISPSLRATYSIAPDKVDQGGFPYGLYDPQTGVTADVNTGDESSYRRNMIAQNLRIEYRAKAFTLNSSTSYNTLNDDMKMDQDFSPQTLFTLNQVQKQKNLSEEIALKSLPGRNYQWSAGLYTFYNDFKTDGPVTFGADGVQNILQKVFTDLKESNPRMPAIIITDKSLLIPGTFDTPSWGGAVFHQSTYNNLLVEGLSITGGIRLDYEKQKMRYQSTAQMNLAMQPSPAAPPVPIPNVKPSTIDERVSQTFLQLLPKASLKYEWSQGKFAYLSVAKGYKAGGYNVQMSADLMQTQMQYDLMKQFAPPMAVEPQPLDKTTAYKPETSWNYETGLRFETPGKLSAELTLFHMNVNNMQLTKFVESGNGRILTNAGRAESYGAELSLDAPLGSNFAAGLNYGYTRAIFRNYIMQNKVDGKVVDLDYKGNYVPYIPAHTLHLNLRYNKILSRSWLDQISASAQILGTGTIYWTEANDVNQPAYAAVNARAGARKGRVTINLWARNLLNNQFAVFYFESFGRPYLQKGRPLQAGVEISVDI